MLFFLRRADSQVVRSSALPVLFVVHDLAWKKMKFRQFIYAEMEIQHQHRGKNFMNRFWKEVKTMC